MGRTITMGARPTVLVTGGGQQARQAREVLARSTTLSRSQPILGGPESTPGPDVVLVAVDTPDTLLAGLATARADAPAATLVAMADVSGPDLLVEAVAAGADGWILPGTPHQQIIETLEDAARGEHGFSRAHTAAIVGALRRLAVDSAAAVSDELDAVEIQDLTPREREIHLAVQAGRSIREIATALSLSEVTVRWHAARAAKKLQVRTLERAAVAPARVSPPTSAAPASRPVPAAVTGEGLGRAELRVALLVAEGLTNKQIAEQLFISRHTVESHLKQVFSKLGVRSRVELTRVILASSAETA